MKNKLYIFYMFFFYILVGCSQKIEVKTLYISHLYNDVQLIYDLPYVVENASIIIETPEKYDKKAYLIEMGISSNNSRGKLYPLNISQGSINVINAHGVKCLEMNIKDGEMASLKVWENGDLVYNAEGFFKSPHYNSIRAFSFLSGHLKVYKQGSCVLEKISDYTPECYSFSLTEKILYQNSSDLNNYNERSYYAISENTYVQTDDYINGELYDETRYNKELTKYQLTDRNGKDLTPKEILNIRYKDCNIYESDFFDGDRRWYMALLSNSKGIFFTSDTPELNSIWRGPAFSFSFPKQDSLNNTIRINCIYKWDTKQLYGTYNISTNNLSEVSFSNPSVLKQYGLSQSINFYEYQIQDTEWLSKTLKAYIDEEIDLDLQKWLAANPHYNSKRIEFPCRYCSGIGKIPQSGGGIILGLLPCPACGGTGKEYVYISEE